MPFCLDHKLLLAKERLAKTQGKEICTKTQGKADLAQLSHAIFFTVSNVSPLGSILTRVTQIHSTGKFHRSRSAT